MTHTQQNLLKAFAGESQARNRYLTFAKIARKENLEVVARVFEETADNERVHAEEEFELIQGQVSTTDNLTIKAFSTTLDNLKMAAEGEKYEWGQMYPSFAEIAKEEKEMEPWRLFSNLAKVEEKHEERYLIIAKRLDNKTLFSADSELEWKCLNCGFIHRGTTPPKTCPVCKKPFSWYAPLGLWR